MKKFLDNTYIALFARLVLGVVFMYASIDKIGDPAAFAQSIHNYQIIPSNLTIIVATVLPWLEILCGVSLIAGFLLKGSSFTTTLLLFVFTLAVISALARSLDISCGCFTQDPAAQKIGWLKVVENTGLLMLSVFLFFSTSVKLTVDGFREKPKNNAT